MNQQSASPRMFRCY